MNIKIKKQMSEIGINNISEIVYIPSYDLLYDEENDKSYQDSKRFRILSMEQLM